MKNKDFIFGITLTGEKFDADEIKEYRERVKKEYDLTDEDIKRLKIGYLFRLSDNIRYGQFDADIILIDTEGGAYYHTGDYEPIDQVKNENVLAVMDENGEIEFIS